MAGEKDQTWQDHQKEVLVQALMKIERMLDPEGERTERYARFAATEALLAVGVVQEFDCEKE